MIKISLTTTLIFRCYLAFFVAIILLSQPVFAEKKDKKKKEDTATSEEVLEKTLDEQVQGEKGIEILCESEVFFTWQNKPSATAELPTDAPKKESKPIRSFFLTVGERGYVEADVKNRLKAKILTVEKQALDHCRQTHQNEAGCISARLKKYSESYSAMDFAARTVVREAAVKDCSGISGTCVSSESTPSHCFLDRPSDMALEKEKPDESAKKDKKGKKGKK